MGRDPDAPLAGPSYRCFCRARRPRRAAASSRPGGRESRRRRSAACERIFFSNQKNIPSRFPRKIVRGDGVVTNSISLAAAQRAPAHSFRCSSFSHRKTLRREPYFRPQTPPTTKGRAAPFFGNHPGVYGDFCYEGRWNRERKMRAGCLWSFQAFHLAGDEVGDGLVDLEPAFVDCRGGALSPPGFWGLMDVL